MAAPPPTVPSFRLKSGAAIPCVAFGTWRIPKEQAKAAVLSAIAAGYRAIDCAPVYQNEREVGEAIAEAIASGLVKRDDLFVTTKVFNNCHGARAHGSVERSLAALGLAYVDLLLMHWPFAFRDFEIPDPKWINNLPNPAIVITAEYLDTWKEMERARAEGLVRDIGVSNFTIEQLEDLLAHSAVPPCVNQIEIHPYLPQEALVAFCLAQGIIPQAYCPFASGQDAESLPSFVRSPKVVEVASRHGATPHQAVQRWLHQRGVMPLPRSTSPAHIAENLRFFHFELSGSEMAMLGSLDAGFRVSRGWIPGHYL